MEIGIKILFIFPDLISQIFTETNSLHNRIADSVSNNKLRLLKTKKNLN